MTKRPKRQNQKLPGKCVFCGATGKMTGEHISSRWMHRYLPPRSMKKYNSVSGVLFKTHTESQTFKRKGDIRDLKIKCVCVINCNNGWMRKLIDEPAMRIMIPLITGKKTVITPGQQNIIAAWATMKLMVSEYDTTLENVTIHHTQRKRIMRKQLPPEKGWGIWIGHYIRQKWEPHWVSHPFLILPDKRVAKLKNRQATYFNGRATTQVLGQLLIHSFHSSHHGIAPKYLRNLVAEGFIAQIWPPTGDDINWPTITINDGGADFIASFFAKFMLRTEPA